jgi:UDP-2,4-diacetamido-2,4,6-trideoxy-beta-L-altropyranose hydrolase
MRIAFRADASTEIGSGHVQRCLALAGALRRAHAEVLFVSRLHRGHLCDRIAADSFKTVALPARKAPAAGNIGHASWLGATWEEDAEQSRAALDPQGPWDWLVVDHYGIDERWENALRPQARGLLVIDDLDNRPHNADLILDQGFLGPQGGRYASSMARNTELLLGPRYALLRPQFEIARSTLRERAGGLGRLLVYFGAFDSTGQTCKTLRALQHAEIRDLQVDVVVGESDPGRGRIEATARGLDNVAVHAKGVDMAAMIGRADLAIGAAGTTTWERFCLGLPSVLVDVAANQQLVAESLAAEGYCVYLGSADEVTEQQIADTLRALAANPRWMRLLARRCQSLVDGRGAQRVANRLLGSGIALRKATPADARAMFEWRNTPENRRYALDPSPLEMSRHLQWVDATLADPDRILLVGELAGKPVGVLRYDVSGELARVSIYLVPGQHSIGLGAQLLSAGSNWMRAHRGDVGRLVAEIKPENAASARAFERAGYVPSLNAYQRTLRGQGESESA